MSDLDLVDRRLDALAVVPPDERERQQAMLTTCDVMSRAGNSAEQIRDVLEALGLIKPATLARGPMKVASAAPRSRKDARPRRTGPNALSQMPGK